MGIRRILSLKKEFEERSKMTDVDVETIQIQNINDTIHHAIKHSPFYKSILRKESSYANGFETLSSVDKSTIMDNFHGVVTYPFLNLDKLEKHMISTPPGTKYKNKFTTIHTSGSSGKIGIFVYDSLAWDTLKALILARCTDFKLSLKRKRMAFIGAIDGHYAGVTLASDFPKIMTAYTGVSVNDPIDKTISHLNKFYPDDIRGYPSGLEILASEQLAGRLSIKPTNIVSSAEPLGTKTKKLIEETFGITPYNFYAVSESIGIAQDCEEHNGMHVFNDQYVLEVVDDDDIPVEIGKPGNVLLTNLYNRCQPLIRYKMNDIATYDEDECDCGSPFPLLKNVEGRREETIWVENGSGGYEILHPSLFVEFFLTGLHRLQIHQKKRNHLLILAVIRESPTMDLTEKNIKKRMKEILSNKNLEEIVEFEIKIVDSISPDKKTGKTKTVISLGPPQL